jgi:hypothetical protein
VADTTTASTPRRLSDRELVGAREGAHRAWRDLREQADEAERRYLDLVLEQQRRRNARPDQAVPRV